MRLVLALLLALPALASAQPDPSGGTQTSVAADDVTVTPGGFVPAPLLVQYSYVPVAAAASQGPTLVNLTFDVGDGLVLATEGDVHAVEMPVDPRAMPPTGVTVEAVFPLRVYCALPNIMTFPEGNASFVVTAEARENGLLKPSKGTHEVRVTCTDPDRAPSVPTSPTPNATVEDVPAEGGKESPLGVAVALAAAAVAALTLRPRRGG